LGKTNEFIKKKIISKTKGDIIEVAMDIEKVNTFQLILKNNENQEYRFNFKKKKIIDEVFKRIVKGIMNDEYNER
jgi:hypothetical protein